MQLKSSIDLFGLWRGVFVTTTLSRLHTWSTITAQREQSYMLVQVFTSLHAAPIDKNCASFILYAHNVHCTKATSNMLFSKRPRRVLKLWIVVVCTGSEYTVYVQSFFYICHPNLHRTHIHSLPQALHSCVVLSAVNVTFEVTVLTTIFAFFHSLSK